jgi:phosphoadenosine phosphosulfate reductase
MLRDLDSGLVSRCSGLWIVGVEFEQEVAVEAMKEGAYDFITKPVRTHELTARLRLNLKVYRPAESAAWQEVRYGKLWEQGVDGITRYNRMNKVEPMQRALDELDARGWIVGLRRAQASTRRELKVLGIQDGYLKVHPIVDWNDKHVYDYLTRHGLPYHPLWEQGYPSIGDWHTSHKLTDGMTEEETRFFGLKRECGLHESASDDGGAPAAGDDRRRAS